MNELHLFAGAGGGILGGMLLGHSPVCAVEIDPYARRVLLQRQRDGILPQFPIWDDVRTFDGRPWRGLVDVVCGGFPCQDISTAGKGAGIDGERSGLWSEMARIIGEVRPHHAFVENSPALTARGLHRVIGDMAELGYDCRWGVVSAADAIWLGGPPAVYHERKRIWILGTDSKGANAKCLGRIQERRGTPLAGSNDRSGRIYGDVRQGCEIQESLKVATPTATDGRKWNTKTRQQRKAQGSSVRICNEDSGNGVPIGGSLNPTWVEWLMGWPLGWTDLKPLEMDKFQQWLHSHGIS